MSDFKTELGFEDCWSNLSGGRAIKSPATGIFSIGKGDQGREDDTGSASGATGTSTSDLAGRTNSQATSISAADKARLARVVRGAPEVMVKVSKMDKHGNPIEVSRHTEGVRVSAHLEYISRNGKIELETGQGALLVGKFPIAGLCAEWMQNHDEDRANGLATDRTRITTGIVFFMPGDTNATAVKDAVRTLSTQEFGGRYDYVMAQHTDTKHPHVHLTIFLDNLGQCGRRHHHAVPGITFRKMMLPTSVGSPSLRDCAIK